MDATTHAHACEGAGDEEWHGEGDNRETRCEQLLEVGSESCGAHSHHPTPRKAPPDRHKRGVELCLLFFTPPPPPPIYRRFEEGPRSTRDTIDAVVRVCMM